MIYNKVYELIGNTPIVKINDLFEDLHSDIYLKLEWYKDGERLNQTKKVRMKDKM